MREEGRGRGIDVPSLDGVEDRRVLGHRMTGVARVRAKSHDSYEAAQLCNGLRDNRKVSALRESDAELLVEVDEFVVSSSLHRAMLTHHEKAEVVDLLDGHSSALRRGSRSSPAPRGRAGPPPGGAP